MPVYAVFIITYRRPEALKHTLELLLGQSHPPREILIVDNDPERSGEAVLDSLQDTGTTVSYHAMKYNAGPAGAAYYGLKTLAEKSYPWIQWIDDDDPPRCKDVNQRLFELIPQGMRQQAGIVTPSGNDFSVRMGRSRRYSNRELSEKEFVYPKTVGGNQGMMISAEVVKKGCLPLRELFFGFEELDFCLQVQRAGFKIIAPTELFIQYRKQSNRWRLTAADRRKQSMNTPVWRSYYSVRNLIYILHYRLKAPLPALYVAFRSLMKGVIYDVLRFNIKNSQMTVRAISDGYAKRLGSSVIPE